MATNADDKAQADQVVDDDKEVTDEDFAKLKEDQEVESPDKGEDETKSTEESAEESEETSDEEGQTDESQEGETEAESNDEAVEESSDFVKAYPNIKGETLDEYTRGVEEAYKNSTSEALRLKDLLDQATKVSDDTKVGEAEASNDTVDPRLLYVDQIVSRDIENTYQEFQKSYPQLSDPVENDKFVKEVAVMSKYILDTQKRVAPAADIYLRVANLLGWKPDAGVDKKDKLAVAVKGAAGSSKTVSSTKPKETSKVTDAEVAIAKQMGGWATGLSDADIRKELELNK